MYFNQITQSQSFSRGKRVEASRVPPVSSYKTFSRIRILTLFTLFHLLEHWRARGGRCELKMVQSKENICKAPRTHSSSCDREEEQQLVESSSSKYCECPSYLCINTQWHQEITPWLPSQHAASHCWLMSGRLIRAIVWYPWPNKFIASLLHLRTYVPFGSSFCVVVDRNTSLPYHWHPRNLLSFCQSCSFSSNSFHLWKLSWRAAGKFSTNSLPPPTYLNVLQISQLNLAIRSTIWRHHYFRAV